MNGEARTADVVDLLEAIQNVADQTGLRPEHVVVRDGKSFVLYAGLLDLAHRTGLIGITTEVVAIPDASNDWTAVVRAVATRLVREVGGSARTEVYTGIGDANESNTNRVIAPHRIRLAETRAKARALRDMVNVGVASLEELGGAPEQQAASAQPVPARPVPATRAPSTSQGGSEPATDRQRWLVQKLANEQGVAVPPGTYDTKDRAREVIDRLLKKGDAPR